MKRDFLSSLLLVALVSACAEERPANEVAIAATPAKGEPAGAAPASIEHHDHAAPVRAEAATPPATDAVAARETTSKPAGVTSTKSAQLAVADLASTILDAKQFDDPIVRETYANAKDIADRLDQMYCYCRCKENEGLKHKSLLTCFQDGHAAGCSICLLEAQQAHLDWKDGLPLEVTLKTVDMMYNNGRPAPTHAH